MKSERVSVDSKRTKLDTTGFLVAVGVIFIVFFKYIERVQL